MRGRQRAMSKGVECGEGNQARCLPRRLDEAAAVGSREIRPLRFYLTPGAYLTGRTRDYRKSSLGAASTESIVVQGLAPVGENDLWCCRKGRSGGGSRRIGLVHDFRF